MLLEQLKACFSTNMEVPLNQRNGKKEPSLCALLRMLSFVRYVAEKSSLALWARFEPATFGYEEILIATLGCREKPEYTVQVL